MSENVATSPNTNFGDDSKDDPKNEPRELEEHETSPLYKTPDAPGPGMTPEQVEVIKEDQMTTLTRTSNLAQDLTVPSNTRKFRVGQRVFENGFLRYGEADYVDEDEAKRLDEVHGTNLVSKEVEEEKLPMPKVGDNKSEWEKYAREVHQLSVVGKGKQQIIDEVYELEDEANKSNSADENVEVADSASVEATDDDDEDDSTSEDDSKGN